MRVAICDEDEKSCIRLRSLIQGQEPDCEVSCFSRGEQLKEAGEYFGCLMRDIRDYQSKALESSGGTGSNAGQLLFRTKTRDFTVQKKEILYVESRKRKVEIHTTGECFLVYATMKGLEQQLGEDFFRCHRGYLVNMAHVAEYDADAIRLENGERIYLAREKYSGFAKRLKAYRKEMVIK